MAWSAIPVLASTDPFDKPTYDILKADLEYLKGDAVWTNVTYQNGWVDFGSGNFPVSYKRVGDFVVLRGAAKSGTLSAVVFTLPVGYRPGSTGEYLGSANVTTDVAYYVITSAGAVTVVAGSNTIVYFDNIWIPVV